MTVPARAASALLRIMTPRRIDILRLAANGRTSTEIGAALWISPNTVNAHLRDIYSVLGARDRAHAVALGMARGFITAADIRPRPAGERAA